MKSIWAGIITYNPDIERLKENICAILPQVKGLVVVDNASANVEDIEKLVESIEEDINHSNKTKIIVVKNEKNYGVAKGLNILMSNAIKKGQADWVVTLDQDTVVYDGFVQMYKDFYNGKSYNNKVASMSCLRHDRNYIEKSNTSNDNIAEGNSNSENISNIDSESTRDSKALSFNYVKSCITSGNIISSNVWHEINGFDERLFIDMVDDDYCYRLREEGYNIVRINEYGYLHELGDSVKTVSFFGKKKVAIFCSNKRKYYLARNVRYMIRRHKLGIVNEYSQYLVKRMLGTLLYEKHKIKGLKAYIKGLKASSKLKCTK